MVANAVEELVKDWRDNPRWEGIERPFSAEDVVRLRGSVTLRHTLAEMGAERLWRLLHEEDYINALGALTGNQAVQQVKAGLKAIYLSGWQVAADANWPVRCTPTRASIRPNSVPSVVRRINQALQRADQIDHLEGNSGTHWFAPIVADAEAGFGGPLNAFELMKAMIEAGAAGVHFEDQLASEKKCGHLGGKVLVPTSDVRPHAQLQRGSPPTCSACRRCSSRGPTPTPPRSSRATSTSATTSSSPASERPRGSSRSRRVLDPRSRARLAYAPVRRSGLVRDLALPTWTRRAVRRGGSRGSPASSSRTTARRPSTGRRSSTTRRSRSSSASWARWATSSSS